MKPVFFRHRQLRYLSLALSDTAKHRFLLKHPTAHVIQALLLARFLRLEIVPTARPFRVFAHVCFLFLLILKRLQLFPLSISGDFIVVVLYLKPPRDD